MQAISEGLLRRGQIPSRTRKLPVKVNLRGAQCRYETWPSDLARGKCTDVWICEQHSDQPTRRVHSGSISARSEPEPAWCVLSVVSQSRLSKPGRNGCWSFSVPSAGIGGQRVRPDQAHIDVTGQNCGPASSSCRQRRAAYAAGAEPTWLTGSVRTIPAQSNLPSRDPQ